MGIGRRRFLKHVSLAMMGTVVDPLQAVMTSNDVYINKKLGLLFQKPSSWGFLNVMDFGRLKDKQMLGNGWNDFKEEVWEEIGDPICIATKFHEDRPENEGIFSPTITVHVTHKSELADLRYESFEELMRLSEEGAYQLLTGLKVLDRYEPYELSGCRFYEYDAEYWLEHIEIAEPLKVELKVLKAEHGEFYLDFNCHQSITANQVASAEFAQFKKSIKLI